MKNSLKTISIILFLLCLVFAAGCATKFGPGTAPNNNQARVPGCFYVYKTSADYFNNIAAIANNVTGEYRLMGYPTNFGDRRLIQDYVLGGGGCFSGDQHPIPRAQWQWVFLNITKTEWNMTMSYPGCNAVIEQQYPQCFGEHRILAKNGSAQADECNNIERQVETGICRGVSPSVNNIIDRDPLQEFYVCSYSVAPAQDSAVETFNSIITAGRLSESCTRLL